MEAIGELRKDSREMQRQVADFQRINAAVTQRHAEHLNLATIQSGMAMQTSNQLLATASTFGKLISSAAFGILLILLGMFLHVDPSKINPFH